MRYKNIYQVKAAKTTIEYLIKIKKKLQRKSAIAHYVKERREFLETVGSQAASSSQGHAMNHDDIIIKESIYSAKLQPLILKFQKLNAQDKKLLLERCPELNIKSIYDITPKFFAEQPEKIKKTMEEIARELENESMQLLLDEFLHDEKSHEQAIKLSYTKITGLEHIDAEVSHKIEEIISNIDHLLTQYDGAAILKTNLQLFINMQRSENNLNGLKRLTAIYYLLSAIESPDFPELLNNYKPQLMALPDKAKNEWLNSSRRLAKADLSHQKNNTIKYYGSITEAAFLNFFLSCAMHYQFQKLALSTMDAILSYQTNMINFAEKTVTNQQKLLIELNDQLQSDAVLDARSITMFSTMRSNKIHSLFLEKRNLSFFDNATSKLQMHLALAGQICDEMESINHQQTSISQPCNP